MHPRSPKCPLDTAVNPAIPLGARCQHCDADDRAHMHEIMNGYGFLYYSCCRCSQSVDAVCSECPCMCREASDDCLKGWEYIDCAEEAQTHFSLIMQEFLRDPNAPRYPEGKNSGSY